jgi:hypothetical protein
MMRTTTLLSLALGVGQALLEQSETDPALGCFINRNGIVTSSK